MTASKKHASKKRCKTKKVGSPLASDLGSWSRGKDLNLRPPGYEPGELPDCSTPHYLGARLCANEYTTHPLPSCKTLPASFHILASIPSLPFPGLLMGPWKSRLRDDDRTTSDIAEGWSGGSRTERRPLHCEMQHNGDALTARPINCTASIRLQSARLQQPINVSSTPSLAVRNSNLSVPATVRAFKK